MRFIVPIMASGFCKGFRIVDAPLTKPDVGTVPVVVVDGEVAVRTDEFNVLGPIVKPIPVHVVNLKNLRSLIPSTYLARKNVLTKIFRSCFVSRIVTKTGNVRIDAAPSDSSLHMGRMCCNLLQRFWRVLFSPKWIKWPVLYNTFFRTVPNHIALFFCVFKARFENVEIHLARFAFNVYASARSNLRLKLHFFIGSRHV